MGGSQPSISTDHKMNTSRLTVDGISRFTWDGDMCGQRASVNHVLCDFVNRSRADKSHVHFELVLIDVTR